MSAPTPALKVVSGYLTATEKRHVAQLIAGGAYEGSTKAKRYRIEPINATTIDVTIWSKGRLLVGDDVKWHRDYAVVELS